MDTIIAVLLGVCLLALPFVFLYLLLRGAARNKDTRERVEALEAVVKTLRVQVDALRHPPDPRPSPQPILAVPVAVHEEPLFVPPPVIVAPRVVEAIHEMTPDDVVEDDILENDVDDLAEDEIEETPIAVQQMADETTPRITWRERLGGTDWEALVGGNWLNKAGVLVFVIGLSLFLGYSLTRFGPAGRVAIGWGICIGLLVGGTLLERRPGYGLFGRGLLAGGWAGSYFTAYAMYALPAARVIDNPVAGTAFLLSVAGGMVLHSLLYRSEALTGLTYFVAFATLNLAPASSFTLLASAPLAASLLTITYRHRWTTMSVVGLIFTYGSLLLRMATSTTAATIDELRIVQAILVAYWLLFETFDLIELRRQSSEPLLSTLFPLNATGFVGLSMLLWGDHPGASVYLYAMSAAGYLGSAGLRALLKRARTGDTIEATRTEGEWQAARGYQGAVTVAAALAAAAIALQFRGIQLSTALTLEGELLVLSGLRLKSSYLRGLGSFVLACVLLTIVPVLTTPAPVVFSLFGVTLRTWVPSAVLITAAFYANGVLVTAKNKVGAELLYLGGATTLLVAIAGYTTPIRHLGIAWLTLAIALLEVGIRTRFDELRRHAYGVGVVALIPFAMVALEDGTGEPWWTRTISVGAVLAYAMTMRLARQGNHVSDSEQIAARQYASPAAAALATAAIWYLVPHEYAGLAWLPLAWVLMEVGLSVWAECLFQASLLGLVAVGQLLWTTELAGRAIYPSLMLGAAALVAAIAATRLFKYGDVERPVQQTLRDAVALVSIVFLTTCAWHVLPAPAVALAWGVIALALADGGRALDWRFLANAGDILAIVVFARLFAANLAADGEVWGFSTRLLTVVPAVPFFYYLSAESNIRTGGARLVPSRTFIWMGSALVFALMRFELGRVFTAAGWSVFAVGLLIVALRRRDSDLRNQSYLVGAAAAIRGWITNFEAPDSSGGLPIEMLVAAVVVSSLYACQFLVPRGWGDGDGGGAPRRWIDRHARELFAIVATALAAAVLFHNAPTRLLTVAWALQGLLLLAVGFPAREPVLRRSGLVLLAVCLTKVLAYDSLQLDTLARIVSFMLLGTVLILVSWIYTRFGSWLRRYL